MGFVSGLALVLLTLVGYSTGAVLGARRRVPTPRVLDLAVVLLAWIAALVTRPELGKWSAIGVWVVVGVAVGAVLARIRLVSYTQAQPSDTGRGLWNTWKDFARRLGNYQSRVLMAGIYFTVVLPFGLGVRFLADPLRIKSGPGGPGSNWQTKDLSFSPSIEEARRQS